MVGTVVEQYDVIVSDTGVTITARSHVHNTHCKRRGAAPRVGILEGVLGPGHDDENVFVRLPCERLATNVLPPVLPITCGARGGNDVGFDAYGLGVTVRCQLLYTIQPTNTPVNSLLRCVLMLLLWNPPKNAMSTCELGPQSMAA